MSEKDIPLFRLLALAVEEKLLTVFLRISKGRITEKNYEKAWLLAEKNAPNEFRSFDRHRRGESEPNQVSIDAYLSLMEFDDLDSFRESNWYSFIYDKYFKKTIIPSHYSLLKEYLSEFYINNDSFNTIGFLNDDSGIQSLKMEELYVDLCYIPREELKRQGMLIHKEKQSSFQKILFHKTHNHLYVSDEIMIKQGGKTMLLGNPGVGKSTYAKWLCFTWAQNFKQTSSLTPIYINLSNLDYSNNESNIISYCQKTYFRILPSINEKVIQTNIGKLHFLFDGFDELSENNKKGLLTELRNLSLETFTLFSRPYGIINHSLLVNNSYEILGFNEGTRLNFLQKIFNKNDRLDLIEEIIKLIKENDIINEISFNPLLLSQLAVYCLIVKNPTNAIAKISSTYQFIDKILTWLKVRYIQKGRSIHDFAQGIEESLEFTFQMEIKQLTIYRSDSIFDPYSSITEDLSLMGLGRKEEIEIGNWRFYYFSLVYQEFLSAKYISKRASKKTILYLLDFPYFWNLVKLVIGSINTSETKNELFIEILNELQGIENYIKFCLVLSELPSQYIIPYVGSEKEIDYLLDGYLKYGEGEWQLIIQDSIQRIFSKAPVLSHNLLISKIFKYWHNSILNPDSSFVDKFYSFFLDLSEKLTLYNYPVFLERLVELISWIMEEQNKRIPHLNLEFESEADLIEQYTEEYEATDPLEREFEHLEGAFALAIEFIYKIDKNLLKLKKKEILLLIKKTTNDFRWELLDLKYIVLEKGISRASFNKEFNKFIGQTNPDYLDLMLEPCIHKLYIFSKGAIISTEENYDSLYLFIKDKYETLENEILVNCDIDKSASYSWIVKALSLIPTLESLSLRIQISSDYLLVDPIDASNQDDLIKIINEIFNKSRQNWDTQDFIKIVQIIVYSSWRASLYVKYNKDLFWMLKKTIIENSSMLESYIESVYKNEHVEYIWVNENIRSVIDRYKNCLLTPELSNDLNDIYKKILYDNELMSLKYIRSFFIPEMLERVSNFDQCYWDYLTSVIINQRDFLIAIRLLKNPELYSLQINLHNAIKIWNILIDNLSKDDFNNKRIYLNFFQSAYELLSTIYLGNLKNSHTEICIKLANTLTQDYLKNNFFKYTWKDYKEEGIFWIYPMLYLYTLNPELLHHFKSHSFKNQDYLLDTILEIGITLFEEKELLYLGGFFHNNVSNQLFKKREILLLEKTFSMKKISELLN